jgi:hypothetical protein
MVWKSKQLQALGGCVKRWLADICKIKEKASVELFYSIRAYSGGITISMKNLIQMHFSSIWWSSKLDVLMSAELSCKIEVNIRVLSPGVIRDNGGIESLVNGMIVNTWFRMKDYSAWL